MARLNWTEQAVSDLSNIAEYIGADSKKYAALTINGIRAMAKQLLISPYSGRKVPEIDQDQVRELIYGNYRIVYYLVSSSRIDILTIHHSSRRFPGDKE